MKAKQKKKKNQNGGGETTIDFSDLVEVDFFLKEKEMAHTHTHITHTHITHTTTHPYVHSQKYTCTATVLRWGMAYDSLIYSWQDKWLKCNSFSHRQRRMRGRT